MPARSSSSSPGSKFPIVFVSTSSNGSLALFSESSLIESGDTSSANLPHCSRLLKLNFSC
uniref:Protein MEI2-like 2 isoform X2 n=1 Tax=Rhizophora mucronata TaxID=61149 RepID=A0A2P2LG60_RHIMU